MEDSCSCEDLPPSPHGFPLLVVRWGFESQALVHGVRSRGLNPTLPCPLQDKAQEGELGEAGTLTPEVHREDTTAQPRVGALGKVRRLSHPCHAPLATPTSSILIESCAILSLSFLFCQGRVIDTFYLEVGL